MASRKKKKSKESFSICFRKPDKKKKTTVESMESILFSLEEISFSQSIIEKEARNGVRLQRDLNRAKKRDFGEKDVEEIESNIVESRAIIKEMNSWIRLHKNKLGDMGYRGPMPRQKRTRRS